MTKMKFFCIAVAVAAAACGGSPAVCGDGICDDGESPSSCCQDCGCAGGLECNAGQCAEPSVVMRWTVEDRCKNGETILLKFFDVDGSREWPEPGKAYAVKDGAAAASLLCTPGNRICFGARQTNHAFYWGVDINNSKPCTQCCYRCAATTAATSLTCN